MPLSLGIAPSNLVPLLLPSPEVLATAEGMLPGAPEGLWAMPPKAPAFLGAGMDAHSGRMVESSAYNILLWPAWGLSRWAVGHFLASARQATDVRELAFGAGGTTNLPLTLRMHAEPTDFVEGDSSRAVDHRVYLLPPKPIGRADPIGANVSEGLYVLTLADERWRLRTRPVPVGLEITRETTWETLLGDLADAVLAGRGAESPAPSFTWPTIAEEDWGRPHPSLLDARCTSLPQFVDAVAASVGLRIVADRDGNFEAMGPVQSQAARDAADLVGGVPRVRYRLSGGTINAEVL